MIVTPEQSRHIQGPLSGLQQLVVGWSQGPPGALTWGGRPSLQLRLTPPARAPHPGNPAPCHHVTSEIALSHTAATGRVMSHTWETRYRERTHSISRWLLRGSQARPSFKDSGDEETQEAGHATCFFSCLNAAQMSRSTF